MSRIQKGIFAAVAVLVVIALSATVYVRTEPQRAISPLSRYARAHWFDLGGEGSSRILHQSRGYKGSTELRLSSPPFIEKGMAAYAERLGPRKWRLRGNRRLSDWNVTAIAGGSHIAPSLIPNSSDALVLLKRIAVVDPKLSGPVVSQVRGRTCFCFWSPKAKGTYVVRKGELTVHFLLKDSVVIGGGPDFGD